jgi:dsDNA-binding SOS-regulon protein
MAVITKFFVVRNGVELDKVFDVKKEAEAYDKMLDAAENLAAFIKQSDLEVELDTKTVEAVSICLAKNAPEVTRILKGIKPASPAATAKDVKTAVPADTESEEDKKPGGKKTGAKSKPKAK